ncbi:hypothetical protein CHUAL_003732 [Chamberlinius hualienensis]
MRLLNKVEHLLQLSIKNRFVVNTNVKFLNWPFIRIINLTTSNGHTENVSKTPSSEVFQEPLVDESESDKILKYGFSKDNVYVVNPGVADEIIKHLPSSNIKLFEINPGNGIVTKTLLQRRIDSVTVFECRRECLPSLWQLQKDVGLERLQVHFINFYNLPRLLRRDKLFFTNYEGKLFNGLVAQNWENKPQVVMLSVLPPSKEFEFLRYMVTCIPERLELFHYGRIEFLLFMSHKCYSVITGTTGSNTNRGLTVAFNLFVNMELLSIVSNTHFSQIQQKGMKKYDVHNLYLVRLVPKIELPFKLHADVELKEFLTFIFLCYRKKYLPMIYTIDKLLPNCCYRLLKLGFTVTQKFSELAPFDYVVLFNEMSSWPEYKNSQFRTTLMYSARDVEPNYVED